MKRIKTIRILIIIQVILFWGCAADRNNPFSNVYHNTTAHYNAYFYANQRVEEVKQRIWDAYEPNYNKILPVFPPLDSSFATTFEVELDDAIKKASIAIQNHRNSRWEDDSYILIGRARLYGFDFPNAVETFKYVNTSSDDKNARHEALVYLMRTFTENLEWNNAIAVSDFLKKEKLNKENLRDLYLTRAYYYQVREDYNNMVQNLALALPLVKKRDGRARYQFIIGQVYQHLGFDSQAYDSYRSCLSDNPSYELSFYAKLSMARVTSLTDEGDVRRVRKYLSKLIRDTKNEEFLDRIYFEWGEFELELNNIEDAIEKFNLSVRNGERDRRQKGLAYLRLGQIYFDTLRQYDMAQAYYDSTIQTLPSTYEAYNKIKQRADILDDFITQIRTIELQDSLLRLASMDSMAVVALYKEEIERQAREQEEEAARQEKEDQRRSASGATRFYDQDATGFSASNWYFDNLAAVSMGQQEFKRIWGNRPLEDNWRRSLKQTSTEFGDETTTETDLAQQPEDNGVSVEEQQARQLSQMMAQLPRTEEAKEQALSQIEYAYYQLGNIYYFEFEEEKNASDYYKKLLGRFSESEYEPEVLYLMYLIYKESDEQVSDGYKDQLLEEHPNSSYAKSIINPDFREESNIAIEQQQAIYKDAYRLYRSNDYKAAIARVNEGISKFQETSFTANLDLLKVIIVGKFQGKDIYIMELKRFIEDYPDSEVTDYARELLNTAEGSDVEQPESLFSDNPIQGHFFALLYPNDSATDTQLINRIRNFHEMHFEEESLNITSLDFTGTESILLVREFPDKASAIIYYDTFLAENPLDEDRESPLFDKFVITRDNFDLLQQNQLLEEYLEFFNKRY